MERKLRKNVFIVFCTELSSDESELEPEFEPEFEPELELEEELMFTVPQFKFRG